MAAALPAGAQAGPPPGAEPIAPGPVLATPETSVGAQAAGPAAAEVRTQWEIDHPGCDINWDGGASVKLPGAGNRSLWLFGDYGIDGPTGCGYKSYGTHAGVSNNTPGQVPVVGTIPTPGLHGAPGAPIGTVPDGANRPGRLLPNPTGLVKEDGTTACPAQVTWYGGAATGPSNSLTLYDGNVPNIPGQPINGTPVTVNGADLVFVNYTEVCVYDEMQDHDNDPTTPLQSVRFMVGERVGMAAWNPTTNSIVAQWTLWDGLTDANSATVHLDANPGTSVVDPPPPLSSPVFVTNAGMATYGSICTQFADPDDPNDPNDPVDLHCVAGKTVMVGVGMNNLHDPAGYKYFTGTGTGWTTSYAAATPMHTLTTNGRGAYTSVVGDFSSVGENNVMFDANAPIDGTYQIWQSTSLVSGWTLVKTGTLPGAVCHATNPNELQYGCYAWAAHPEFSTPSDLMFSVYDPDTYEIEVSSIGSLP